MSDKFVMSSRQSAELDHAFERNGWSSEDVKWLSSGSILADILKIRRGYSEIKPIENFIDLDADPWLPNSDWKVEEHRKGGVFNWNPIEQAKPECQFFSKKQRDGRDESGNDLRKILANEPVLNANVLDWLLKEENQRFIPREWKDGKARYFWGTIYHDLEDCLRVRYLYWNGIIWRCEWHLLKNICGCENSPAVLRASSSV